jgi:hypothetical protein
MHFFAAVTTEEFKKLESLTKTLFYDLNQMFKKIVTKNIQGSVIKHNQSTI